MRIHMLAYVGQLYAYAYFEPMYAGARRHALKNPNPEDKNITRKNNKSSNLACFKIENN